MALLHSKNIYIISWGCCGSDAALTAAHQGVVKKNNCGTMVDKLHWSHLRLCAMH